MTENDSHKLNIAPASLTANLSIPVDNIERKRFRSRTKLAQFFVEQLMDKKDSLSSPVRRSMRIVHAKQNEQKSPIQFLTSAEAVTVSDSDSSSDENVRKRARHADNSDTEDDLNSGSDEEKVDVDEDMEDGEEMEEMDELVCPVGKKKGGSILFKNMRTRSTCNILRSAIADLTTQQRLAVASMGLEGLLGLEITRIPSKISRFVVNSFEHMKMKLETESGSISVSEGDVRHILGLPLGGRIFRAKDRCVDSDLVRRWRMCFNAQRPSSQVKCSDILKEMAKLVDGGEFFKLHFLVLFYSSIVMSNENQYCNQRILNCIETVDDVRSLNWCENVIFSAMKSKENWLAANKRSHYTGPILFLTTLYITRFEDMKGKFDILWPAIRGLTNKRILNRQKAEIKRGGFGRGLRIVRFDGSPKNIKHAMNEAANDAEASTSRVHSSDAEAILNLLKEAVDKLVSAKSLYDSATDETKNDKQLSEAVQEIQSTVSQFMLNSDRTKSSTSPMDFEGPSFSIGLTQELDKVNENVDDVQMEDKEPYADNGMPFSYDSPVGDISAPVHACPSVERCKDQKGKSPVFVPVFYSSPVPVEKWTDPQGITPVFAPIHASPTVEKWTEPRENNPVFGSVCDSSPVPVKKSTAPQGKTAVIALPAQMLLTPRAVPYYGKSMNRYGDYQKTSSCADGQGKYVMKTPEATKYCDNTVIVPYSTAGSSRRLHVSHYAAGSSFVPTLWVDSDGIGHTNFSPILPLQQRDDDFVMPDLPILKANSESASLDIVPHSGASEALPVNVCRVGQQRKPGEAMKSPFVERITNVKEKITQSEIILCDYVFECDGEDNEILFKWGNTEGNKTELASLCPGFEIKSRVLDIWTCILNKKEELRTNKDFLRFFCTTNTTMLSCRKYHSIERQHQLFGNALDGCLARFPDVNMSKISMLLFPVYNDKHFILVCFDFKRTAIDILDSQAFTNQYDIIFSVPVQSLLLNFGAYLRKKGHHYAHILPKIRPVLHVLPWATKKPNNSGAIFVMRDMETYFGGGLKVWKCGLRKEGNAQIAQLNLLRQRYLNEIVRFEQNTVRSEVMRKSAAYRRTELELNRKMDLIDGAAALP
ncbi:hypothetical protein QQ045_020540 [Rhodiola kirilowii]